MAKDSIERIKEAEREAQQIISQAHERAHQLIADAQAQARARRDEAIATAKSAADDTLEQARRDGGELAQKQELEQEKQCQELRRLAEKKRAQAVELVIAQITGQQG